MKPLSKNKRRGYLFFFFLVFIIATPSFIFQAKGYRLNWGDVLNISQTGGLYINTDQSGIEIYLNNKLFKKTSIVQKGIFIQDLKPGDYEVRASKDGLQPWTKTLKVFPEIVTEARSFLIQEDPELVPIPEFLVSETIATTSVSRKSPPKNPEYEAVALLFAPPVTPKTPATKQSTTTPEEDPEDMQVKNDDGKLTVLWVGEPDEIPSYFCENVECKSAIVVSAPSKILSFDFFPGRGDLLILRLESGIFVSEIDDRSPQNRETVVSGTGYEFRVKGGKNIYLKKDNLLYEVSL